MQRLNKTCGNSRTIAPWGVRSALLLLISLGMANPLGAQTASVPPPIANGDFVTALQPGNRGNFYPTRKWLVVDPDPTYLNCRVQPNGAVRSRFPPGAILTAVFGETGVGETGVGETGDAVILVNGVAWLRVSGADPLRVGEAGICYVRANQRYIAPINEEAIQAGGLAGGLAD